MVPATEPTTAGSTNQTPSGVDVAEDFGANDWLLEEMYEQYRADPSSVDPSWVSYFAAHGDPNGGPAGAGNGQSAADQPPGSKEAAGSNGTPNGSNGASATARAAAPAAQATTPAPRQSAPETKSRTESKAGPTAENGSATTAPAAPATTPAPARRAATIEPGIKVKSAQPSTPGKAGGVPADPPNPSHRPDVSLEEPVRSTLRGAPARTAKNMDISLSVPTATSVRSLPVKLMIDQRVVINNHLRRARGGKVSYTHLIGYAMVQALKSVPEMNNGYEVIDGKPTMVVPAHVNLGLAIDMPKPDGTRQLLVPSIKSCESLDFAQFWAAYEHVVKKARSNSLTVADFADTTITLTNPGTIGTNHSVPRLMSGQGCIIGVGSMEYPPEFQGSDPDRLSEMSVSKVMTMTSTYDHRVIQGAQSGQYLARLHALLLGEDGFYDDIFGSLRIPYEPIRWAQDISANHETQVSKQARIFELINAYRVRGHLMADTDPLEYRQRSHHDLDVQSHGLTLWDLDREFATGAFAGGQGLMKMRKILGILRDSYCRTIGIEYMHISEPVQRRWIQDRVERPHESLPREEHLRILDKLNEAEIFETFLQTKFVGQKRFSLEGGESTIPLLDELCEQAAANGLEEVCIG
ncbi:MAG TPA: 2-oxo acid dehydrogenase subunit E2, partial [Propionibacteriaceae bacterium]